MTVFAETEMKSQIGWPLTFSLYKREIIHQQKEHQKGYKMVLDLSSHLNHNKSYGNLSNSMQTRACQYFLNGCTSESIWSRKLKFGVV